MLEVKSIDRSLGTPVSYAYAVKAGPWIFLTGHDPDFHAFVGGNAAGAQHINQRAIDFIMDPVPRQNCIRLETVEFALLWPSR